jgi:predicted TIM-barrel fold metal-dependent hydrolase
MPETLAVALDTLDRFANEVRPKVLERVDRQHGLAGRRWVHGDLPWRAAPGRPPSAGRGGLWYCYGTGARCAPKETAMPTLPFSCDSHVVEAPEVFHGLEERYGSRAPRIVTDPPGRKGTFVAFGGTLMNVGRLGIAGGRLDDPKTIARMERGYEGLNPGCLDPGARLREQEVDGVGGEVLYPSINMAAFAYEHRDVVHEVFRRHNDWMREYCSEAPDRLVGIGCLPLPDVDAAIAELERAAGMGLRGVAIPCTARPDKPYSHPDYEPFWTAAERVGLPVSMHIFCGATPDMGLPAHWGMPGTSIVGYTMTHGGIVSTIGQIICGGVAARHPGLRFVCCEFETGWLAHVLQRLDHATYRARAEASRDLTMPPSEYFRRQWFATFEDDHAGVLTRHLIGVDNLIWGNDYPHHDSIWPRSQQVFANIFKDVPADEVERMVGLNVRRLYGLAA